MRSILMVAILSGTMIGSAWGDPAYQADDILKAFAPARGICVGTEAECGAKPANAAAQPAATFNLLVTFDLNSADLTDSAKENLDEFAKALQNPLLANASFQVEGHTDARGSDGYNVDLSERRAASVVEYLRSKGVETSKLTVRGFGKAQPRTPDPFDAENRRVEARLVQ